MYERFEVEVIPLCGITLLLTSFDVNATDEQAVMPCHHGNRIDSGPKLSSPATRLAWLANSRHTFEGTADVLINLGDGDQAVPAPEVAVQRQR